MKVVSVPCVYLKSCKKLIVTKQFFIVLTGRSALILTKSFDFVKKIDGLKYVYEGKVSPDGTKLLLISNGAEFYMLSLETLELLWKDSVKEGKYCNLEGKGIWTLDGTHFLLIIFDQRSIKYRIRCYDAVDSRNNYDENALCESYRIHEIISISSLNTYVLLVQDLLDVRFDLQPRPLKIIHYRDGSCKVCVLLPQNGIPIGMDYQEYMNKLVIYTDQGTFSCDLNGQNIREITLESTVGENTANPFAFYGISQIKRIALSKNDKYVFIASSAGFDICDKNTGAILYSKEYSFGVEGFDEIEENLLVVYKYKGSASMYKIQK